MSFRPLNQPPDDHAGEHRYVHVVGSTVFIDDRPAEVDWNTHFVGVVDGHAWWAVDVPRGAAHRVANNETHDLVFVEVQVGDYFGEDDIERLEDDYGRRS